MTYFYEDFRVGNSNGRGGICFWPRVFQQKLKSTHIYDGFRIFLLGEKEAPEQEG